MSEKNTPVDPMRSEAARVAVGPAPASDAREVARQSLARLTLPSGFVLGDVIAQAVLDSGVLAVADEEHAALVAEVEHRVPKAAYVQMCDEADREMLRAEAAEAKVAKVESAVDRIESLAKSRAITARARGHSATERDWLDVLAIIERAALADAPADDGHDGWCGCVTCDPSDAPAEQRCPTCGRARDDHTPGPHAEGWGLCPESFHYRSAEQRAEGGA